MSSSDDSGSGNNNSNENDTETSVGRHAVLLKRRKSKINKQYLKQKKEEKKREKESEKKRLEIEEKDDQKTNNKMKYKSKRIKVPHGNMSRKGFNVMDCGWEVRHGDDTLVNYDNLGVCDFERRLW